MYIEEKKPMGRGRLLSVNKTSHSYVLLLYVLINSDKFKVSF